MMTMITTVGLRVRSYVREQFTLNVQCEHTKRDSATQKTAHKKKFCLKSGGECQARNSPSALSLSYFKHTLPLFDAIFDFFFFFILVFGIWLLSYL